MKLKPARSRAMEAPKMRGGAVDDEKLVARDMLAEKRVEEG